MGAKVRPRFWWEAIIGAVTGVLGLVTIFWSDWIEAVFRVNPDHGNGGAEWFIATVLLGVGLALAFGARLEWRRARPPWPRPTAARILKNEVKCQISSSA